MARLSIILPSRDERFLVPTIHDIFRNVQGEIEVIAVIDSDKWPENWKQVTDQYPNLHTIFHGKPLGMRRAINDGVGSAISRGAKFVAKFDAHCSFSEGFDEILTSECDKDWIVVPRRGRLDADNWCATDTHKLDIDYHYLSFPSDPNDFGGPGLNGKVWEERARERANILVDDEMSSQGSGWLMHAEFFTRMGFMDESRYGPFWNEFQELGMCAWLSGGQVKINKKCKYLHLHKGRTHGRGYRLDESWLRQGRDHTMKWIFNEAWDERQVRPFSWLIEHFWPVPSWPENWEEILYASRKPRFIGVDLPVLGDDRNVVGNSVSNLDDSQVSLKIHTARYGVGGNLINEYVDVVDRLQQLVKDNSLDIVVNNSTLTPGENPFRGKKKRLLVRYSIDGGEVVDVARDEKDWLIIGPVVRDGVNLLAAQDSTRYQLPQVGVFKPLRPEQMILANSEKLAALPDGVIAGETISGWVNVLPNVPTTAPALNDYLIRKFSISPQRFRGPMPIELRDFHRNDLAQLFAELGFKRGAEIGVAEGNYSEVLLKANPECELLLVDPWHAYSDNPQNKSKEKNEYALNETRRKTAGYKNVNIIVGRSMDVIHDKEFNEVASNLDFVYLDAHHSYPYIMTDLIEWTKRVRSGGIVAGDDVYTLNEKWGAGPMEAIYDYTRAMKIHPWFLINAHRSVDFFFVKL